MVHQGIALKVLPLKSISLEEAFNFKTVVILDNITDPHNIGAILRSANAFNIDAIVIQKQTGAKQSNTGVLEKVSSGATESVPIIEVVNISETINTLKNNKFWVGGVMRNENTKPLDSLKNLTSFEQVALVMGAEGKGIRPKVQKNCDFFLEIPINTMQDSLNVSNAAAIIFWERYKSKNF